MFRRLGDQKLRFGGEGRGGGELGLSLRLERVVLESALPGTEILKKFLIAVVFKNSVWVLL